MAIDYIVIRRHVDRSRLQGASTDAAGEPAADGIVEIGVEKLDEAEAQERNADPELTAVPDMPVSLIAPLAAAAGTPLDNADAIEEARTAGFSWGIEAIGADASIATGAGVKVAVIDTGIDSGHAAFAGVNIEARNFLKGDPADVSDRNGHGTHCAGTIFGRNVDGVRIGVALGVTDVLIAKALDDKGAGSIGAVLAALEWARERKANIISLSLGFDFPAMVELWVADGLPVRFATAKALGAYRETLKLFESYVALLHLENVASRGAVILAATGNESQADVDPRFVVGASVPAASAPDVISVGAAFRGADKKLGIAPFSNVGPRVSAPGVDIVSAATGGGLASRSGTSMACPHVAGVAALWWQSAKLDGMGESAGNVRASVIAGAHPRPFAATVGVIQRGKGLVRAP